ncbi:MAG: hypothetical protein HUJ26_12610 [Planctomycetaceae bacterium]|nr:hypothetical protein [Planctomycetaceae bacterium]
MHYRNGREAKNGDEVIHLEITGAKITAVGILHDAEPGNDYCNGKIAPTLGGSPSMACLCDCLHVEDFEALLAEKGLDKRPDGM